MKQYTCVHVSHHKDVGNTIDEWLQKGWRLHTYTVTFDHHYLLFESGE